MVLAMMSVPYELAQSGMRINCKRVPSISGCAAGRPSLAEGAPDVAADWHPTRNKGLDPHKITCGSAKKVWWLCKQGKCSPGCQQVHEWQTDPLHRVIRDQGCPVCAGQQACACNNIAVMFPEVIQASWDWAANEVSPEQLTPGSNQMVHWKCSLHEPPHRWQTCPNMRFGRNSGCPACFAARQRRTEVPTS